MSDTPRVDAMTRDDPSWNGQEYFDKLDDALRLARTLERELEAAKTQFKSDSTHPDDLRVIWYEDTDKPPEVFYGAGAADAAMRRYLSAKDNWICHLLVHACPTAEANERVGE